MIRQLRVAVAVSALAVLITLVVGVTFGLALKARMTPEKKKRIELPLPGPLVTIEDQVYNLSEPNRYLKATVVLEADVEDMPKKQVTLFEQELQKRVPKIRDLVIRTVNTWTFREINTPQGKRQLKEDLRKEINRILARGELKRVMFTSFAVQ